jgi:hypothetical protein
MKLQHILPFIAALTSLMSLAAEATKMTWDFEHDEPGKVAKGFTSEVGRWEVVGDDKWHTLRVTMSGAKIACYFDGQKHLEVEDTTFPEEGKIGLWSKADAQSYFDDLTVGE